ncbi:hypothetical protein CCHOA_11650 [Corynebacterium choanae]|uniref:Uncharacterized protein n=1 Tax=Corynebacterium choanae TaxID=1862358 RepID=A0A3G6J9A4_9CORY|nr:hypothetical protein CCHOA_11650 [Corynebacterium choanae]
MFGWPISQATTCRSNTSKSGGGGQHSWRVGTSTAHFIATAPSFKVATAIKVNEQRGHVACVPVPVVGGRSSAVTNTAIPA